MLSRAAALDGRECIANTMNVKRQFNQFTVSINYKFRERYAVLLKERAASSKWYPAKGSGIHFSKCANDCARAVAASVEKSAP